MRFDSTPGMLMKSSLWFEAAMLALILIASVIVVAVDHTVARSASPPVANQLQHR